MPMTSAEIQILITARDAARSVIEGVAGSLRNLAGAAATPARALAGLAGSMAEANQRALSFAAGIASLQAVRGIFGALADAAIGVNARLEQSRIAWTTMLGSAAAAEAMLRQLQDFAAETPFEFPELNQDAQQLLAMGIAARDVIPLLRSIGDTAAGLGRGPAEINRMVLALGQMTAKGRVQGDELLQLTEVGVPALKVLADALGKTTAETQKMAERGQIAASTFVDAFRQFASQRFGDMSARQAQTFNGALSTIRDNLRNLGSEAFRPLFAALSEAAQSFAAFSSNSSMRDVAARVAGALQGLIGIIRSIPAPIRDAAVQFAALAAAIIVVVPVLTIIGTVLGALATPIGLVIGLVGALAIAFNRNLGGVRDTVQAVLPGVLDGVLTVVASIVTAVQDNLPRVVAVVQGVVATIVGLWQTYGPVIVAAANAVWSAITTAAGPVLDQFVNVLAGVIVVVQTVFTAVGQVVSVAVAALGPIVQEGLQIVADLWAKYGGAILAVGQAVWNTVVEIVGTALANAVDVLNAAMSVLQGDWGGAWAAVQRILVRAWDAIVDTIAAGARIAALIVGKIASAFGAEDLAARVAGVGGAVDGIAASVKAAGEAFLGAAEGQDRFTGAGYRFTEAVAAERRSLEGLVGGVVDGLGRLNDAYGAHATGVEQNKAAITGFVNDLVGKLFPAQEQARDKWYQDARSMRALSAGIDAALPAVGALGGAAQAAGDQAAPSIQRIIDALIAIHPATVKAAEDVAAWKSRIETVNLAIVANRDQIKAAQAGLQSLQDEQEREQEVLRGMQDRLQALNDQLDDARRRFDEFSHPQLVGMGEMSDQIFAVQQQIKALELQEIQFKLGGGTGDFAGKDQLEKLRLQLDALEHQQSLAFDAPLRELDKLANSQKEITFDQAKAGLTQAKADIDRLTASIAAQQNAIKSQEAAIRATEAAMKSQQRAIQGLQADGERLNATLQNYQDMLKKAEENQRLVEDTLKTAIAWFVTDRKEIEKLGPAGAEAAQLVDEKTTALLGSLSAYAASTDAAAIKNVQDMRATYDTEVDAILAKLGQIPKEITTVVKVVHQDVYGGGGPPAAPAAPAAPTGGAPTGGAPPPAGAEQIVEARAAGGPVVTGRPYIVGEHGPELFVPSLSGRIIPRPDAAGIAGGDARIDYDRLAAAIARQPVVVNLDGDVLARAVRARLLRTQRFNTTTGLR
jgi:tape measure domain-containing protein